VKKRGGPSAPVSRPNPSPARAPPRPPARYSPAAHSAPLTRLALPVLGRVAPVHHVAPDLDRQVPPDRPGLGRERVGRADQLARGEDDPVALPDHGHHGARDDVLDQRAVEGLGGQVLVVLLGEGLGGLEELEADELEACFVGFLGGERAGGRRRQGREPGGGALARCRKKAKQAKEQGDSSKSSAHSPLRSKRPMMSPTSPRCTPSGLTIT